MQKLRGKPFALIGVNANGHDARTLKALMDKETLNWRSFAGLSAIWEKWNLQGTPTFYVLDHQGTIRHKWVGSPGETAIGAALEKLIKEAEQDGKNTAK